MPTQSQPIKVPFEARADRSIMWIRVRSAEQNCFGRCRERCETERAGVELQKWANVGRVYLPRDTHVIAAWFKKQYFAISWVTSCVLFLLLYFSASCVRAVWVGWNHVWIADTNTNCDGIRFMFYSNWWQVVTFLHWTLFITAHAQSLIQLITYFLLFLFFASFVSS